MDSHHKPVASREQDAADWVGRLCRGLRESLGAERVIAWLYDAPAQSVIPLASDDDELSGFAALAERWPELPLESFPAACTALLELRPTEIRDAQDDARIPVELAADLAIASVRFEPLAAGTPVGMLSVEPASAAADPQLYSLLPVVAAAMARASSEHNAERRGAEAEFLLAMADDATAAKGLAETLAILCERLAEHLGARGASAFLWDEGRLEPAVTRLAGGPRDPAETEAFLSSTDPLPAARAAAQARRPVRASGADSPLIGAYWASALGIASVLAVPIERDGRLIGVLALDDSEPNRFTDDEARIAAEALGRTASAIEQARIAEESLSQTRAASAIRRLLQEGAGAVSVSEAAEIVARVARETLGAERATVLLEDEDRIEHVVTVGDDGDFEAAIAEQLEKRSPEELKIWSAAGRNPRPLFVESAAASRLLPPDLVERLGLRSYATMPLLSKGRPIGMVILSHTSRTRKWDEDAQRLLGQLMLEGSLVVENAALRAVEHDRIDELSEQAFHDPLTGLPNRALMANRMEHAFARMNRRKGAVAVLFIDLDGFKDINDNTGHEAGDRLLVAVSRRLQASLRPEDTIARLGGDEFTVLIEDLDDTRFVSRVAERITESLKTPFIINGAEASITASIGIALSTGFETTPEELLRHADAAMYEAKRAGKARSVVYSATETPPADEDRDTAVVEDVVVVEDSYEDAATEADIEVDAVEEKPRR